MKSTWPPPQVIFVGLELNQHGHAASHEHASSSWPVIFQGVLSFGSFAARAGALRTSRQAASVQSKRNLVFIARKFMTTLCPRQPDFMSWPASRSLAIFGRSAFAKAPAHSLQPRKLSGLERVTRLELATSSLARRCSTTELHPQF